MADVRLIDANALRAGLREAAFESDVTVRDMLTMIDLFPTIDAVPVVHGRWIRLVVDRRHQIEGDECSACGFVYGGLGIAYFRYCPNCGAKMDAKEE